MQPLFLVKLLGVPFFSYTTLTIAGVVLALAVTFRQFRLIGEPASHLGMLAVWIAVPALAAGRVVHIATNLDYFVERPTQLLSTLDGGFGFVGVFCGGCAGLWSWCRWRGAPFRQAVDSAALPVTVLATCAWLAAFMHGSQYGAPVDNMFALELRDSFGVIQPRWPTPLLAALWSALIGLILISMQRAGKASSRDTLTGQAAVFLALYGAGLWSLEFTRGDLSVYILGLRLAQWLYLVLFATGIIDIGRRMQLHLTLLEKSTRI